MSAGATTLATSTPALAQGAGSLSTGLDRVDTGLNQLAASLPTLATGAQAATDGAEQIATGNTQLVAGYNKWRPPLKRVKRLQQLN